MDIKEAVDHSVISTLSDLGFVDAVSYDDFSILYSIEMRTAKVKILMPFLGSLFISMPISVLEKISVRLFPEIFREGDLSLIDDAAKEFVNIIAGKIFQYLKPDLLFELGLPEIVKHTTIPTEDYIKQSYITIDDEPVVVIHRIQVIV